VYENPLSREHWQFCGKTGRESLGSTKLPQGGFWLLGLWLVCCPGSLLDTLAKGNPQDPLGNRLLGLNGV
jgi:hypothetical protein